MSDFHIWMLLVWVLLWTLMLLTASHEVKPAKRPNFIIILADDIGWGDLDANQPERKSNNTPNLNLMAAQGLKWEVLGVKWLHEFVFIHNNTSSFFFLTGWQTFTPRPRRALRRVRPSWQAATASETGWPITLRWSLWRDYLCLKSPSPSCCRRKVITQLWSGNGTWDTMVHTGQPREVKCVLSESDNIYQTPTIALKHKSLNMKTF